MLIQLTIKNLAIIDDINIEFKSGMSALTGETGAGKSIIIDALSLISKERANSSLIGRHSDKAFIEGVFALSEKNKGNISTIIGDFDEDTLIVSREIDISGRSTIRINGRITTLNIIRQIMNDIVDIHSQHENQYLLNSSNHINLLDGFAKDLLKVLKDEYQKSYQQYLIAEKEYNDFISTKVNEDELEFFKQQLQNITAINLVEGEIEELTTERQNIAEFETISTRVNDIVDNLAGDKGAVATIFNALKSLEHLKGNEYFYQYKNQLEDAYYNVEDISNEIKIKLSSINFNETRLNELNEKLFEIAKLQRKYGMTYQDIKNKQIELENKIKMIENYNEYLEDLKIAKLKKYQEVLVIAEQISKIRVSEASKLSNLIIKEARDLHLEKIHFKININKLEKLNSSGIDEVEFLVSMNSGLEPRSLVKVVSGGELSRLMLSLKVIFSKLYGINTIIFDEIDNGVSGKVALSIAEKMKLLSKNIQVITVTHMPSIAAYSDHQYLIEKYTKKEETFTKVTLLEKDERVKVIAKMLDDDTNSNAIFLAQDLLAKVK